MAEFDLVPYLRERRRWVNEALEQFLPPETERPAELIRAVRYSVLSEGKRLRPILCMAACEAVGGKPKKALGFGCVLEYIHAYSLIHDDLPAMDNDDFRRGRPTCHKVFGEALAILAGDALNSEAFSLIVRLARAVKLRPALALRVVEELALAIGFDGVVAGQVEDMAKKNRPCTPEELDYIHRHKTAALIRASVRIGAIAANAKTPDLERLSRYGEAVGLAFQIVDDLLDEGQSDKERETATYVSVHGRRAALDRANQLRDEALAAIKSLGKKADPLRRIAHYIVEREI